MNPWQFIKLVIATTIDGTRAVITCKSSGILTITKPNKFVWTIVIIIAAAICVYSIFSFRSEGPGYTQTYGVFISGALLSLMLLCTYSRPFGYVLVVFGWVLFFSCIGVVVSDWIMGYSLGWGHQVIGHVATQTLDVPRGLYAENEGRILIWGTVLAASVIMAYLGFKLYIPQDLEKELEEVKQSLRQVEAEQEDKSHVAKQEEKERRAAKKEEGLAQKSRAKGGYQACPNCQATNWKGKRLAIAECRRCKTYFCKTCAGAKKLGRVQTCPKCNSDSFKQKGFVEP